MGGPRTHMTSRGWGVLAAATLVVTADAPALAQSDGLRLLKAVEARDAEAVGDLLARQADANFVQADGSTALLWAAYHDDLELVEQLLEAGAAAGAANDYGVTPLALACANARPAVVDVVQLKE